MKRALAARAKHDPNGLAPPGVVSSPPKKIPRIESKPEIVPSNNGQNGSSNPGAGAGGSGKGTGTSTGSTTVNSQPPEYPQKTKVEPVVSSVVKPNNMNANVVPSSSTVQVKKPTTTTAPAPAPAPAPPVKQNALSTTPKPNKPGPGRPSMKRQRASQSSSSAADDDDETGAFFLKHQNAALSSELQQLRYQFSLLEKERDFRRTQCQDASQVLQSLEATWTAMEVALQLGQQPSGADAEDADTTEPEVIISTPLSDETPRSTGTGESVELIGALLDSLAAIAKEPQPIDGDTEEEHLRDISRAADSVSKRATALQRWIWGLLRKVTEEDESGKHPILKLAKLEAKMSALKSQVRDFQTKVAELAKCRDNAVDSERKVRRGLYRLNAGRMKLDEVMEAIETEDKDGSSALMILEENPPAAALPVAATDEDGETIDSAQVAVLRKQVRDLEEISSSREKQIDDLTKEREGNLKRITELALSSEQEKSPADSSVSEDDIKRSELYTNTWTRMTTVERQLSETQAKLTKAKDSWAAARGDAEHATKSLEEHLLKHKKRWAELTDTPETENGNNDDEDLVIKPEMLQQAELIAELEHKLKQALENVRRSDVVRVSLDETTQMNDAFQARLDDLKAKNNALINAAKQQMSERESKEGDKTPSKQEAPSAEKAEKMYKEHRRMRKDLAGAVASKEHAKAKLEKSEKDREHLIKTNSRLAKQSAEKDEMNAKSLSTILHLKSVTEKLTQERQLLELQVKSAGQVNVAARLAANAKDRVTDEAIAQRKEFEQKIAALERECEKLKVENEKAIGSLSQKKAEMSDLEKDAATAKARCDELVAESTKQQEEKRKILESLAVAQRETGEASKLITKMRAKGGGGGGTSGFTSDQLETQIKVLKHRLSCPVCNHRDKSCIVLRCRHMFCKPCIDENIKNRSRKCPSCGQRFDTKDIEDIWL